MNRETNQTLVYVLAFSGSALGFLITSFIATQYLAKSFNYSPSLGETFLYGFYNPFQWIFWSVAYYSFYPDFFKNFFIFVGAGIALCFLIFITVKLFFLRKARAVENLHGSAHFASKKEIESMGILNNNSGVYIGGYGTKKNIEYLRHNGAEHIIAFAPTRSGKGVGLVIPTLLSWGESVLVIDIKGELWSLTAGWRKKYAKNKVLKFDPTCTDDSGVKFNILEEIRIDTLHEVKDTQNIAINIIFKGESPSNNSQNNISYFKNEATSFLTASILYLLHKNKQDGKVTPSLADLYRFVNNPEQSIDELLNEMLESSIQAQIETIEVIQSISRSMLNKATQELSGVIGSFSEALNLYADPIIAKNIAKSEFKIDHLMNYENPVSLYLIIPPSNKDRLKPLMNLLINQIFRKLTDKSMEFDNGENIKHYKHRLLFMADEFTAVGKLGVIEEQLAYMAGYGIKAYLIIQDLTQLYGLYTKEESIISNCHIRIAYAPNKIETADLLSKMSGITTVVKKSITSSGKRTAVMLGNVSETIQEVQRPLLTPDECMRLKSPIKDKQTGKITQAGDMLIFIAGSPAIYGKQILFFQDEVFLERSKVALEQKISDITM